MQEATPEQVRDIVRGNDGNDDNVCIASLSEIQCSSYSYTASQKSYHIVALSDTDETRTKTESKAYLLLTSPLASRSDPPQPLTLPAVSALLHIILDKTTVPVPRPVAHDVSGADDKWPFGWLLLRLPCLAPVPGPPISLMSVRHQLSSTQLARVELRLGAYLRALHGITNDVFGAPMDPSAPPEPPFVPSFAALLSTVQSQAGEGDQWEDQDMTPYSWQATFVLRLEELLDRVCGDVRARQITVDADIHALRFALSRAIGSFLFDDVEVPRLVWVTGSEEDVVVTLTPEKQDSQDRDGDDTALEQQSQADVAYILPTFGNALWGDPLMEAWFLPPGPSMTMKEGYFDGEDDGTLIVFPRHKTKRTWYTVYLALSVLAEEMSRGEEGRVTQGLEREMVRWAKRVLPECVEMLKNAPCY